MNIIQYSSGIILSVGLIMTSSCSSNDTKKGSSTVAEAHNKSHHPVITSEESAGTAEITFEKVEFDFGTINEGEMISHTYYFTNTSNVPLIIQNATPSCGCTVPEWSKDPIPPGGSGKIEVSFDSNGKKDAQNRTVSVVANTDPSITTLRIKGMVIPKATQAMGPIRKN